ncbi:MAG TPA: MBL fold metallo-hydrolase, partial [Anaerolineales bacterium]|nr:MBL fold metallo-hydrolase [Anaerolineales bacterium]
MIANPDGNLHIYMLSVGQGDTTVVVSPGGRVIVMDAKGPGKIMDLLDKLGCEQTIEHLVISHPHADHFSGGNALAKNYTIENATFAPFWHKMGMGPATYRKLVAFLNDNDHTNINFLSGYSRWYPDDMMTNPVNPNEDPEVDPDAPYLELLGPTNGLIEELEESMVFNTNHLSIIGRLTWRNFRIVIVADAQMENWGPFDDEQLLEDGCQILRTAHHGSSNGTQWERLSRLSPSVMVI